MHQAQTRELFSLLSCETIICVPVSRCGSKDVDTILRQDDFASAERTLPRSYSLSFIFLEAHQLESLTSSDSEAVSFQNLNDISRILQILQEQQ